jgi:ketol-acid reductoisomerase
MAKYEVEQEAGIPPEAIIMEQYLSREMAYIFERAATEGLIEQLSLHSQTSQYGQLTGIESFDGSPIREYMQETLRQIQTGEFATEWTLEQKAGYPTLRNLRQKYNSSDMIETEQSTLDKFGLRES